jgi:hypothetical protein
VSHIEQGGETLLQSTKDGATAQPVFVKDNSVVDVQAVAKRLAGYTD